MNFLKSKSGGYIFWHSFWALWAEISLESTIGLQHCAWSACWQAHQVQNPFAFCEAFQTNLDRLGLKQEQATLDRLADNKHPTWKKNCESVKQRQKVSLEQYAKTGGRGMDISLLSLNKSQPRMLDTSLQLWKSYLGIRTGVNKITPYQQMKCFNKSATSWFFRKWRNCSHLFGLMIVFFLYFDWFLSMICISIFYFFFSV